MKGSKDTIKTRSHINCLSTTEIFNAFAMSFVAGMDVDDRAEYFL